LNTCPFFFQILRNLAFTNPSEAELFYKYQSYFWFIRKRNDIFAPYNINLEGFANVFQNQFNFPSHYPFSLAVGFENDLHNEQVTYVDLRAGMDAGR
jgi:hypothetical protein